MSLVKMINKSIEVRDLTGDGSRCSTVVFVNEKVSATYPTLPKDEAIRLATVLADNDDAKAFLKSLELVG
jgi:hypothetical protein